MKKNTSQQVRTSLMEPQKQESPHIDPVAARLWASKAPSATPWLHQEVARRMAERLDFITTPVQRWVHWQAVRGSWEQHPAIQKNLESRFGAVQSWLVETQPHHAAWARQQLGGQSTDQVQNKTQNKTTIAQAAKSKRTFQNWFAAKIQSPSQAQTQTNTPKVLGAGVDAGADYALGERLQAFAPQMLWSNMALHLEADPLHSIATWSAALAPGGYVLFSCLGPDTLRELGARYKELGWGEASHAFTDMHDWGDALQHVGFAEPVVDMERIVLTYSNADAMIAELRSLGRNLSPARPKNASGLRGRAWFAALQAALEADKQITFEVIYGHAFKPEQSRDKATGEVRIGLDSLRRQLKRER